MTDIRSDQNERENTMMANDGFLGDMNKYRPS